MSDNRDEIDEAFEKWAERFNHSLRTKGGLPLDKVERAVARDAWRAATLAERQRAMGIVEGGQDRIPTGAYRRIIAALKGDK